MDISGLSSDSNAQQHAFPVREDAFQSRMLQGVSRTFALTIPLLPPTLRRVVGNAYLLCRIVDTIEDEPALTAAQKRTFCEQFARSVTGERTPELLEKELAPLLSESTLPAEQELVRNTGRVIRSTRSFTPGQRAAIERCIRIMAQGMAYFQEHQSRVGLSDQEEMDRYCYYVAGVVGEMLAELFCEYSPEIARHRSALMPLAVSFGQALQMTNILKDVWDDHKRGACWLPRAVFEREGFNLDHLSPGCYCEAYDRGLVQLIGVAHAHLRDALAFSLLIPSQETGIRLFCLWAAAMALLTLRKIHGRRDYTSGSQVKITRRTVKGTFATLQLAVRNDLILRAMARWFGQSLPLAEPAQT